MTFILLRGRDKLPGSSLRGDEQRPASWVHEAVIINS